MASNKQFYVFHINSDEQKRKTITHKKTSQHNFYLIGKKSHIFIIDSLAYFKLFLNFFVQRVGIWQY